MPRTKPEPIIMARDLALAVEIVEAAAVQRVSGEQDSVPVHKWLKDTDYLYALLDEWKRRQEARRGQ